MCVYYYKNKMYEFIIEFIIFVKDDFIINYTYFIISDNTLSKYI